MPDAQLQPDDLIPDGGEIKPAPAPASAPSPHLRLLAGIGMMLVLFLGFGVYTARQMRQLRLYQRQVLERGRRDTLQLLRIQEDAYELTLSVENMAERQPRVPILVWRADFLRLRRDLDRALAREARLAPPGRGQEESAQMARSLKQFWNISDQAFGLARRGFENQAVSLVNRELAPQGMYIHNLIARWLAGNSRRQQRTERAMQAIYRRVTRNFIWLTALLLALAGGIAVWVLRANRASFAHERSLVAALDRRSHDLAAANRRLLEVQETTLKQVARDLHDELGQLLTALGSMLTRVQQHLPEPGGGVAAQLREARGVAQEAQQKLRGLAQMLRPPALDDFGLEATLREHVRKFEQRTGIAAEIEVGGTLPWLPPETAIHLYRIAQEALTNVARHAGARRVKLSLEARGGWLRLRIADDGAGLGEGGAGAGLGLSGMRERAELLGGRLRVETGPGTAVEVQIPLKALRPAAARPG